MYFNFNFGQRPWQSMMGISALMVQKGSSHGPTSQTLQLSGFAMNQSYPKLRLITGISSPWHMIFKSSPIKKGHSSSLIILNHDPFLMGILGNKGCKNPNQRVYLVMFSNRFHWSKRQVHSFIQQRCLCCFNSVEKIRAQKRKSQVEATTYPATLF